MYNYTLLFILALCLGAASANAQSEQTDRQISTAISGAFGGTGLRGQRFSYSISMVDGKLAIVPNRRDSLGITALKAILRNFRGQLIPERKYHVNIYFDEYSANVYATFHQINRRYEEVFINYDNYLPSPKLNLNKWLQTVYNDLYIHKQSLEKIPRSEWPKGVLWLIDPTGKASPIDNSPFEKYLDSSKSARWTPGLYYGHPVHATVRIRLDKDAVLSGNEPGKWAYWDDRVQFAIVLPVRYKGSWVRFEKDRPKPDGRIIVSLIFNPVTLRMENPLVHKGPVKEAKNLIAWLDSQPWKPDDFYWKDWPYTTRSYFCLD